MFTTHTYQQRRRQLIKEVANGIILLPGNEESSMNYKDNLYHFRQDSSFLYYSGIDRASLVIALDADSGEEYLFGNDLTIEEMVWTGPLPPLSVQAGSAGIKTVQSLSALTSLLKDATSKGRTVHFLPPYRPETILKLAGWLDIPWQTVAEKAS